MSVRRFLIGCIFVLVATIATGFLIVRLSRSSAGSSDCVTHEGTPIVSPDRAWSAWTEDTGCDFGFGLGYAVWNVRLASRERPSDTATIFSTDSDGEPSKPAIRWLADRRLAIATIGADPINLQTIRFGEVVISYTYTGPCVPDTTDRTRVGPTSTSTSPCRHPHRTPRRRRHPP